MEKDLNHINIDLINHLIKYPIIIVSQNRQHILFSHANKIFSEIKLTVGHKESTKKYEGVNTIKITFLKTRTNLETITKIVI